MPKRKRKRKRKEEKTKTKTKKILERIFRGCPMLSGIIIIIFVIFNLQHAHGISPGLARSQKGSLSRSDNCPEQLLSPSQLSPGKSATAWAWEPYSYRGSSTARTFPSLRQFPFGLRRDSGASRASRLTIFKIHYNWYCSECINTNKWACQAAASSSILVSASKHQWAIREITILLIGRF